MRIFFNRMSVAAACAAMIAPVAAAGAAAAETHDDADRLVAGSADGSPCVTPEGGLVGLLDDDQYPDAVTDEGDTGEDVVIAWGSEDGYEEPVSVRSLVGAEDEERVLAASADFTGDGLLDLVVVVGDESSGDDPVNPRIGELRVGPLNRDAEGERTDALKFGELKALGVADFNGDDLVDLAGWQYYGDGPHGITARLGTEEGLHPDPDPEYSNDDAEPPYTPDLPQDQLQAFYPDCAAG